MAELHRMREAIRQVIKPRPKPRTATAGGPEFKVDDATDWSRRSLLRLGLIAGGAIAAGAYEFWPLGLPVPSGQAVGPEYRTATLAIKPAPRISMPSDGSKWSNCMASQANGNLSDIDLVMAVDTTGSMGGVLADVKANLNKLISNLRAIGEGVRVGIVAYKDICDREVVRQFPLTPLDGVGVNALTAFISTMQASGGCDWPEKMDLALDIAASMAWRGTVPASIVVIADAPAHPADEHVSHAIAQAFMTKIPGGRVSLIDTGSGGHPFMRSLPKSGGGQYITYDGSILNSLYPAISGCA